MNWVQKISQRLPIEDDRHIEQIPETYLDVGHGYRRNRYNETEQFINRPGDVLLWWWENNQIKTAIRDKVNTSHDKNMSSIACGRIDFQYSIGSIEFAGENQQLHRVIIEALIDKFPQIKFTVFDDEVMPLQQYWEYHFAEAKFNLSKYSQNTLYHGTNETFDTENWRPVNDSHNTTTFGIVKTTRHGIFLSTNPNFAQQYGKHLVTVQANIQNTATVNEDLRYKFIENIDPHQERELWLLAKYGKFSWGLFENELGGRFVEWLKSQGYDSAQFQEDTDGIEGTTIVVFDPKQIRRI